MSPAGRLPVLLPKVGDGRSEGDSSNAQSGIEVRSSERLLRAGLSQGTESQAGDGSVCASSPPRVFDFDAV